MFVNLISFSLTTLDNNKTQGVSRLRLACTRSYNCIIFTNVVNTIFKHA